MEHCHAAMQQIDVTRDIALVFMTAVRDSVSLLPACGEKVPEGRIRGEQRLRFPKSASSRPDVIVEHIQV
jgi:hypothetical protein